MRALFGRLMMYLSTQNPDLRVFLASFSLKDKEAKSVAYIYSRALFLYLRRAVDDVQVSWLVLTSLQLFSLSVTFVN